ncbi:hypothetical protein Barb6_02515 [Bacteroidales bacterium Barb6]|nr:hypothetical protein Barb6_02515 [Bacteroidales bacterium Barb6]
MKPIRLSDYKKANPRGKPAGTIGCEFCYGVGENLRPEDCLKHEIVTKSIFVKLFDRGAEA